MLRPKIPTNPTASGYTLPGMVVPTSDGHAPACGCQHTPARPAPAATLAKAPARPTVQLTPGALVTVVAGGTSVVLVVGTVLVSLLLAVAVTAASVAVCAIVLRSMLNDARTRR